MRAFVAVTGLALLASAGLARAEVIGGVEFPLGALSFADRVTSFELAASGVKAPYDDPQQAVGAPNYTTTSEGTYVSLGNAPTGSVGGALVLEFIDNRLVDIQGDDLYIFEIGPAVEATEAAISVDGVTWYELGVIQGSTRGIDIGKVAGVPLDREFRFVRLRDAPGPSTSGSPYAGPDIDAVGAIGSVAAPVMNDAGMPPVDASAGGAEDASADGSANASADASASVGVDASTDVATLPTSPLDAATTQRDAGSTAADSSTPVATTDDPATADDDDGGCTCSTHDSRNVLSAAINAVLFAALLLLRRRRMRRQQEQPR